MIQSLRAVQDVFVDFGLEPLLLWLLLQAPYPALAVLGETSRSDVEMPDRVLVQVRLRKSVLHDRLPVGAMRLTQVDDKSGFTVSKAIAGMHRTEWRRILVRLREAPTPASSNDAGGATKKAGEKTSQAV